ncbi:hypothetical protein DDZ18_00520 [Marinicauda salina]|uniref:Lycopene cyclase n=1 Tax=Marinicauda salina TaxID=2135793 RepID=A0A2U2BVY7_9PROT|nr:lycopene cyclase family protein [Marinicauda salina]PWE18134.1 hypothetical protein DDZ18_00520 [Marinicauda salina]
MGTPRPDFDLVIIGAGVAGLSLAARIARSVQRFRVCVLDPKPRTVNPRSWCFWAPERHGLAHLVSARWRRWLISGADGDAAAGEVGALIYQHVRAADFQDAAFDAIAGRSGFSIEHGVRIGALEARDDHACAETGLGRIRARRIVDTRPGDPVAMARAPMLQLVSGAEVEADADVFDPDTAGLMTDMAGHFDGLRFVHLLPFSPRRALVEAVRFSTGSPDRAARDADLDAALQRLGFRDSWRVIRRERASLPLGPAIGGGSTGSIVRAPAGAGAMRAATGSALMRLQGWAEQSAAQLQHGRPITPPRGTPPLPARLERGFLARIARHPDAAPTLFLHLARSLPADVLARFLGGEGTLPDHLRIMAATTRRPARAPRRLVGAA